MREHDEVAIAIVERRVTCRASCAFKSQAGMRFESHFAHCALDAVLRGNAPGKIGPAISIRAEAVMDVQTGKLKRMLRGECRQHIQQHHRIDAAGETERQPRAGRNVRGENGIDARDNFT